MTATLPNPARAGNRALSWALRSLGPIVAALAASSLLLALLGKNPAAFFGDVLRFGLLGSGWQGSLTLLAPLLLVGLGILVAFRAKLWNLGYDGQFLLAAALVAGLGPGLTRSLPYPVAVLALALIAALAAAAWGLLPAVLRATAGTNEIVTTLMMSFLGVGVANLLVKGVFQDPAVSTPQTAVIPTAQLLPFLPGTAVHLGLAVALIAAVAVHVLTARAPFGARADAIGANPRAAASAGVFAPRVIIGTMLLSGALIGLAAAVDVLGVWGYMRSDWNPGYGQAILPFVFLARLRPLPAIPFVLCYAVLATGGTMAAQRSGLSVDFLLVIVALILLFMAVIELLGERRALGQRYLPEGLRERVRSLTRREGSR